MRRRLLYIQTLVSCYKNWHCLLHNDGTRQRLYSFDVVFIDLSYLNDVRQQVPTTSQKRHDLYKVTGV